MSEQDPEWRPGNRPRRGHEAGGAGIRAPELGDLDEDDLGHTLWIRGRVKNVGGAWRRDKAERLEKRVYSSS